jgi:zinc-finger binding domain of transposase IS66
VGTAAPSQTRARGSTTTIRACGPAPSRPFVERRAPPILIWRYLVEQKGIDVDSKECPCCGGALHLIDETRTEMLDIVPAQRLACSRRATMTLTDPADGRAWAVWLLDHEPAA